MTVSRLQIISLNPLLLQDFFLNWTIKGFISDNVSLTNEYGVMLKTGRAQIAQIDRIKVSFRCPLVALRAQQYGLSTRHTQWMRLNQSERAVRKVLLLWRGGCSASADKTPHFPGLRRSQAQTSSLSGFTALLSREPSFTQVRQLSADRFAQMAHRRLFPVHILKYEMPFVKELI